jgi:hypothetical protein
VDDTEFRTIMLTLAGIFTALAVVEIMKKR